MSEEATMSGAEVGSVNPTVDPNDDALLDGLGFGDEQQAAPTKPQMISEPESSDSDSSDLPSTPGDDFGLPDDVVEARRAATETTAEPKAAEVTEPPAPPSEEPAKPEPKFNDPKANHAFAELRHQNSELQKKLSALESKLSEVETSAPETEAAVSQYEERIRELEEQIGQYDLAATPAFRQKYDVVLEGILSRASSMLQKAGASEEESSRIIAELRGKDTMSRAQELNEFAPALSAPVVNLLEDFDELLFKREAELKNWRESKASIAEEERRMGKSKSLEIAETIASSVLTELEADKNPFFLKSSTDASWNDKVEERAKAFRGLLKTGDPAVLARLVAEGLAAQELQKLYFAERDRRAQLQSALETRRGLSPRPGNQPVGEPSVAPRPTATNDDELLDQLGF